MIGQADRDRAPGPGAELGAGLGALAAALSTGSVGRALVGAGLTAVPVVGLTAPLAAVGYDWHTVHSLCVRHKLYDAPYQAKAKREHTSAGVIMPRGRGYTLASLRTTDLGRPRRFTIWTAIGLPTVDLDKFLDEVNHHLAPEVYSAHRRPGTRRLELTVAPPLPEAPPEYPVALELDLEADVEERDTFPIGHTRLGLATLTLGDLIPHLLIAAPPGWGKSTLLNLLLYRATRFPEWWRVHLIDPEGDLDDWREVPGVASTATTIGEQVALIEELTLELELRTIARNQGIPYPRQIAEGAQVTVPAGHPAVPAGEHIIAPGRRLLVVDELASVMSKPAQGDPHYQPKRKLHSGILDYLWRGRKRGFHCVAATTDPRADVITGPLRDPFRARLAGGYTNRGPWSVVFDGQPPRRQPARHGLGWYRFEGADMLEVQVLAPPTALAAVLGRTTTPLAPAVPSDAPSPGGDS